MAAGPTVKQLLQTYPGKIRLVVKNYPYKYRDFARIAAEASLAAQAQGRYWEMHDLMMARSPKLDRASLIAYAGELGLDVPKFTKAIDGGNHAAEIDRDLQLAQSIDLYNTPTFYINGRQVVGERPFDFFKKIIDEELQQAGR
ncbi:MAG: disulfide bond formation protein D, selenocysteine-containing [uncultured bacterium]|nr:MAG: disulfide bond formation protein D, selenocysteine-containing [uncultured bacterium]